MIVEKLSELLSNSALRHEMGFQARKRALEDFSSTGTTRGLLEFYKSIV